MHRLLLLLLATVCCWSADRKPLVLDATNRPQNIQAGDTLIVPSGLTVSSGTTAVQALTATSAKMGGGTYSADDSILLVRRESTAVPNSHAARDESVWTVASGGGGYCSYDALVTYAGASAYNHLHGFQSRQAYTGSGSLTDLVGYWSQEDHSGSGTVTARRGVWIKDPTGAGVITTNYGVKVEDQTRGTTNYAIHTGAGLIRFGGALTLDSASTTPFITASASVAGSHGMAIRNTNSGTGSYAYISLRNDSNGNTLFTQYSSGYTGSEMGVTAANYSALLTFGASTNGLLIGSSGVDKPIIFGTNSVERARISSAGLTVVSGLTVSSGTTAVQALTATGGTFTGNVAITNNTASPNLTVTTTSTGAAQAFFGAANDSSYGIYNSAQGTGQTGSVFGISRAGYCEILTVGTGNGLKIGNNSAGQPIIFGGGSVEMARFSGSTLASDSFQVKYTTASTTVSTGSATFGGGIGVNGQVSAVKAVFAQSLNGIQEVTVSNSSNGASAYSQIVAANDGTRRAYFGVVGSGASGLGGANTAYVGSNGTCYLLANDAVQASIDTSGINLASGKVLRVNATQVVGARKTGWATATGTATRTTFDTATVTTAELAERVKALIDDVHAAAGHGLIGN